MNEQTRRGFWREALAVQGSIIPQVVPQVAMFGLLAAGICALSWAVEQHWQTRLGIELMPHELAGAALGLLLVFRTNAGYDRWWEARKLWGGFVDRTRNLTIDAMSYGPQNSTWRTQVAHWTAAFIYVARDALRGAKPGVEVVRLLGAEDAARVAQAEHMPCFVAMQLADLLQEACQYLGMDRFAFLQVDRQRSMLIDNFGGCERILRTPLPLAYSIKIRHFLLLFLLTLPLALLHRLTNDGLVPIITMLVAYPLLSLDQLGVELENPFATSNLSHLPLDNIASTIEGNVLGLLNRKLADD